MCFIFFYYANTYYNVYELQFNIWYVYHET